MPEKFKFKLSQEFEGVVPDINIIYNAELIMGRRYRVSWGRGTHRESVIFSEKEAKSNLDKGVWIKQEVTK